MTDTFNPPKAPGYPAKKSTTFLIKKAEFGENHVQVAKAGMNNALVSYDLTWPVLSIDDATAIEDFFVGKGGFEAFYYTVPNDVQRLYRTDGPVVRAYDFSGVACSISVTIREVFL